MAFRVSWAAGCWLCALCGLGLAADAAAQGQAPAAAPAAGAPAPAPFDPSPIIGLPVEPSEPVAAPARAETSAPADPAAATPAQTPVSVDQAAPAPAPSAQPTAAPAPLEAPPAAATPAIPSHDAERPPFERTPDSGDSGFAARLSLGIGAALWINNGDLKLSKPVTMSLDLGYALNKRFSLIARGSSWLRDGELANEFFGVGAVYHFVGDHLYVAGVLGVSLTRDGSIDQWQHRVQGAALEIDVGQTFALSAHTDFAVGAHFQFGTPWGGTDIDAFTSLHAGVFVSLGLR